MVRKSKAPMAEVRRLLEAGVSYERVAGVTGYSESHVWAFARAWGISRKRGRPRKDASADFPNTWPS